MDAERRVELMEMSPAATPAVTEEEKERLSAKLAARFELGADGEPVDRGLPKLTELEYDIFRRLGAVGLCGGNRACCFMAHWGTDGPYVKYIIGVAFDAI